MCVCDFDPIRREMATELGHKDYCFYCMILMWLVTPHVTDVMGVIVLTLSVCVSVRLAILAERTDIRT